MLHIPSLIPPAILIVDDEPFIALDLAMAVEDAGCLVVGPAGSVREALSLLEASRVTAAILDVNLGDGDVTPVVEVLVARGIPLIFQTGGGLPPVLKARYPDLLVYAKPIAAEQLVGKLIPLIPQVQSAGRSVGSGRWRRGEFSGNAYANLTSEETFLKRV